jgi:hypothetical protein
MPWPAARILARTGIDIRPFQDLVGDDQVDWEKMFWACSL